MTRMAAAGGTTSIGHSMPVFSPSGDSSRYLFWWSQITVNWCSSLRASAIILRVWFRMWCKKTSRCARISTLRCDQKLYFSQLRCRRYYKLDDLHKDVQGIRFAAKEAQREREQILRASGVKVGTDGEASGGKKKRASSKRKSDIKQFVAGASSYQVCLCIV